MTEPSSTSIDRSEIEDCGDLRLVRRWHPNGTLVEEVRCKILPDGGSMLDGTSRRWNSKGELIGSFDIIDGRGIQCDWFDNGQLFCENPLVDGMLTGLQRGWDESGFLIFEKFWYHGASVSKKRYRELQRTESEIPTYDEKEFKTITQKKKRAL